MESRSPFWLATRRSRLAYRQIAAKDMRDLPASEAKQVGQRPSAHAELHWFQFAGRQRLLRWRLKHDGTKLPCVHLRSGRFVMHKYTDAQR